MNLLDLLLVLLVLSAAVNGYRLGILARASSWGGLLAGLVVSVWTVPLVLRTLDAGSAGMRLVLAVGTLALTMSLLAGLGELVGLRLRSAVSRTGLGGADRALGTLAGAVSVLLVVWLLVPAAAQVPGMVASQVRQSTIVGLVRTITPQPPDAIQALRGLIDQSRFPEVFDDLAPTPDLGPPPEELPVSQQVISRVESATVNVEARGCDRQFEGSGWTVSQETVITNAHVVAGADQVQVRRPDGRVLDGTVVVFDDNRDLAVLRVPGLGQQPLSSQAPETDAAGAAVGYPGGQNQPRSTPARVTAVRSATGRDIYGEDRTERRVVFLAARLAQGDSGGPVINPDGGVVGTTFAISPDRPTTAFALAPSEVEAVLQAPRSPGRTGRCL